MIQVQAELKHRPTIIRMDFFFNRMKVLNTTSTTSTGKTITHRGCQGLTGPGTGRLPSRTDTGRCSRHTPSCSPVPTRRGLE